MKILPSIWRPIALAVLALVGATASASPTDAEIQALYRDLVPQVRFDRIKGVYESVTSFGSRLTGSSGEAKTFDYVESRLKALGVTGIRRQTFPVTVPDPDARGTLNLGGRDFTLFPLWPNLVRSSTCDVSGPLVYGGDGSLETFRGKDIRGSIVILEFGSASRWRNAAKLGAKAIIFLESTEMNRGDAEQKYSSVPIDVPRFYLPLAQASPILDGARRGQTATLKCKQEWLKRDSTILSADLPGSDPALSREPMVLMAYADAMSVVPGIAPGAEAIGGIAGLLETAEVWSKRPHKRPLRLVLAGGHHMGLSGARAFVQNQFERKGG
ncbi:MAG: PA domain-containing protein, partial [Fimbriimonas sp.]